MRDTLKALVLVSVMAWPALAEIVVPPGFTARRIAPLLDQNVPRLAAIADPDFGTGVLTAAVSGPVVTLRRIGPDGTISALGAINEPSAVGVIRVRLDSHGLFDGLLHIAVHIATAGPDTALYRVDRELVFWNYYRGFQQGEGYDFDFGLSVGVSGMSLLDQACNSPMGGCDSTRLAIIDELYQLQVVNENSVPPGRTDTDVWGLQRDCTGLYGGGILLADWDNNNDGITAIYELRDVDQGGTYRLIGPAVVCVE